MVTGKSHELVIGGSIPPFATQRWSWETGWWGLFICIQITSPPVYLD